MKKILIITYYWPPSGGAGVQRWLKFVKYLPQYGWQPIVIAPENPNYPSLDHSLLEDIPEEAIVNKLPIWEPYDLYRKFLGLSKEHKISHTFSDGKSKPNWKQKISLWLKCNIFIPDPRVFWYLKSRKEVLKIIKEQQIQTFITTSPPNSVHLFGLFIKKNLPNIHWIADFRDPWTGIYFEKDLPYTFWSKKINKLIESKVISNADIVSTVSRSLIDDFKIKYPKSKLVSISNGYDDSDISEKTREFNYTDKFVISYLGTLYNLYNMPKAWEAISELLKENIDFKNNLKIIIAGSISNEVLESFKRLELESNIEYKGYVSHEKVKDILANSHAFLLTTPKENNKGILTGKVFEYMGTLKPIICITSLGNDLDNMIEMTKSGVTIDFDDKETIKKSIMKLYKNFENKEIFQNDISNIESYSRKNITKNLIQYIS